MPDDLDIRRLDLGQEARVDVRRQDVALGTDTRSDSQRTIEPPPPPGTRTFQPGPTPVASSRRMVAGSWTSWSSSSRRRAWSHALSRKYSLVTGRPRRSPVVDRTRAVERGWIARQAAQGGQQVVDVGLGREVVDDPGTQPGRAAQARRRDPALAETSSARWSRSWWRSSSAGSMSAAATEPPGRWRSRRPTAPARTARPRSRRPCGSGRPGVRPPPGWTRSTGRNPRCRATSRRARA